jgi:hypothetical protein
MVTEARANCLLKEDKVIWANLSWRIDGEIFRLEAKVLCLESEEILSLRGTVGKKNRSFVLLYQNTPIRKYTVHAFHRDPVTRERVTQPHKHWWDDEWEDKRVYIPNDIRIGNANDELVDFLQECNISLRGNYASRMFTQEQ